MLVNFHIKLKTTNACITLHMIIFHIHNLYHYQLRYLFCKHDNGKVLNFKQKNFHYYYLKALEIFQQWIQGNLCSEHPELQTTHRKYNEEACNRENLPFVCYFFFFFAAEKILYD